MDPNPATPGDTATPPVAEATPVAPAQDPTPNGSEPDNNAGKEPAMVPSDRLREETEKRRKAEQALEELKNQPAPAPVAVQDDDVTLDEDTEKLLDSYAKKRGLVSKSELAAQENAIQVRQDVKELEATPPVAGIPYNHQDVLEFAKTNNLPITSKAALQAAYKEMNWDKIMEARSNAAVESYKTSGSGGAEKPGSQGAQPPGESEITGDNPKERTRNRIAAARQKISA